MNIFFLSWDPKLCAQEHSDRHVVKMILETAQMLYTACWYIWYEYENNIQIKDRSQKATFKPDECTGPSSPPASKPALSATNNLSAKCKFELLEKIYEKQTMWAVGSDINKINDSIKILSTLQKLIYNYANKLNYEYFFNC